MQEIITALNVLENGLDADLRDADLKRKNARTDIMRNYLDGKIIAYMEALKKLRDTRLKIKLTA